MGEGLHVNHIQRGRLRGVLTVDTKDAHSVEQLKDVISTQHALPGTLTLFYRGVNLDDHEHLALDHLIPDLQKLGAPRFSVRSVPVSHSVESGDISLTVHVDAKSRVRKFQVDLPAGSTVADLTQAVSDHEGGLHPSAFCLIWGGRRLGGDSELADYILEFGSTVDFMWPQYGGGGGPVTVDFVDMENTSALKTSKVVYNTDCTIPHWKCICNGLNIQGKCQNHDCEAFGSKYVYCKMRYTIFNVAQVVLCPACQKEIKATTCGFSGCQWMFELRRSKSEA